MKTIDFSPKWEDVVPIYIQSLMFGTGKGVDAAKTELTRMAKLADAFNDLKRILNPMTIVFVKKNELGDVDVTTLGGMITTISVEDLNGCTGCDADTLEGAVGQILD